MCDSTLFPPANIAMGPTTVFVENTRDTMRASHFRVQHPRRKHGAGVRLDFETGRIACTACPSPLDCIHADAVRKYLAAQQPLDTGATGADRGNRPF